MVDDRGQNIEARSELMLQRPARNAGALGDLRRRHGGKAVLADAVDRRLDEFSPRLGAAFFLGAPPRLARHGFARSHGHGDLL